MDFSEQIQEISNHINGIIRNAAAKHKISFAQAQFLLRMPSESISISELSNLIGVDISTMSRNVTKLKSLELIDRKRDTDDLRSSQLFLTDRGMKMVNLLFSELDTCTQEILLTIPIETQNQLGDVLEQLNWAFTQYREK